MTVFTKLARDVFASVTSLGLPRKIDPGETARWGSEVERATSGASAGRVDQATWSELAAVAGSRAGQPAQVLGPDAATHSDPVTLDTVANEGTYVWSTAPAGWRRVGGLSGQIVHALNTGAGTVNNVLAQADLSFSTAAYDALITVNFVGTNTGAMTISIDGETPRPLVTNTGAAIPSGYVQAGMSSLVQIDSSGNYRLFSYGDAALIQAAAEAARDEAETARDEAEAAQAAAEAAVTFNRVSKRFTTTDAGPYDMGVGNTIGTANNLDVKIGGVLQDHDKYTVDGTEFTLTTDPGAGLDMEAVLTSEARVLNAPADGTVDEDTLVSGLAAKVNKIVTVEDYGVVYDNSAGDRQLMHDAAMAAVAAGRPFVVPTRGLVWNEGLVIQVPEDFSTIQEAHDAMLDWIIPATAPKYVDTTQNHISPVSVTISVSATIHTQVGTNITWNHPQGDRIRLKGRGKTSLTFASQQAVTFASGTHPCRLRFSTWPATDPAVGSVLMPIVLTGSGEYQNFEGGWRITAVNAGNKDITFAAYAKRDTSALTSTIGGGLFFHLPCVLRFTNIPYSGADSGCIDVHTTLRMSDIAIMGDPSNDPDSSNGIFARENARVLLDQHCAILEHKRSGLWLLNNAYAQIGFSSFCGNDSGINNLQGIVDGSRTYIQGNTSYNYIGGVGSSGSIVQSAFGGSGGSGILINGNASLICSGHSRRSNFGVEVARGGYIDINDMNVRANTTFDLRRRGSGRIVVGTADYGTTDPAIDTGDSFGGFTALSATLDAVT